MLQLSSCGLRPCIIPTGDRTNKKFILLGPGTSLQQVSKNWETWIVVLMKFRRIEISVVISGENLEPQSSHWLFMVNAHSECYLSCCWKRPCQPLLEIFDWMSCRIALCSFRNRPAFAARLGASNYISLKWRSSSSHLVRSRKVLKRGSNRLS